MSNSTCTLVALCLLAPIAVTHGRDSPERPNAMEVYNRKLVALEQEWDSTPSFNYFKKARDLSRDTERGTTERSLAYHAFQLDLVSSVLAKRCDGIVFGVNADSPTRRQQARLIRQLAEVDLQQLRQMAAWPELRTRYARLLMLYRAMSISMQDPSLDGEPIVVNSTVSLLIDRDPKEIQERARRQARIRMNYDLKRFLKDNEPRIEGFMVSAFSEEPTDFRLFNELLMIGLYTAENRARLLTAVESNTQPIPDVVKAQLAMASDGKTPAVGNQMPLAARLRAVTPAFDSFTEALKEIQPKYPEMTGYSKERAKGKAEDAVWCEYSHNFTRPTTNRGVRPSDFGNHGFTVGLSCRAVPPPDQVYSMSPPVLELNNLRFYVWAEVHTAPNPSTGLLEELDAILKAHLARLKAIDETVALP